MNLATFNIFTSPQLQEVCRKISPLREGMGICRLKTDKDRRLNLLDKRSPYFRNYATVTLADLTKTS